MKNALLITVTGIFFLQPSAFAEEVVRMEDLPAQRLFVPPASVDIWSFYCPAGGSAKIKVDTIAMALDGKSPLNPAAVVFQGSNLLALDNGVLPCADVPSDCAATCVDLTVNCASAGEHNVLVFNNKGETLCGKSAGTYKLSMTVFAGAGGSGTELPAAQVALGGEPAKRILSDGARLASGPAEDDAYWNGFIPPGDLNSVSLNSIDQRGNSSATNIFELLKR
ncbi:MAG: hypothetical protein WBM76_13670 [Woeseiaceae bacterium]